MGRTHVASAALSSLLPFWLAACDQSIEIGVTLPPPPVVAGAGEQEQTPVDTALGGSGGGGGSLPSLEPLAGASAAASEGGSAGQASEDDGVVWQSGFETGDVSEWTSDGAARGGEIVQSVTRTVSTERAHSGTASLKLVFDADDGQHHWAELYRRVEDGPAYYSAWFFLDARHTPQTYWSIFYFFYETTPGDSRTRRPLWDLNLNGQSLYFYDELSGKFADATPARSYPVVRWFHLEAYLEHPAQGSARLVVWQDGEQILDLAALSPAPSPHVYWAVGTQSDRLSPAACTLFLDDAAVSTHRVGP